MAFNASCTARCIIVMVLLTWMGFWPPATAASMPSTFQSATSLAAAAPRGAAKASTTESATAATAVLASRRETVWKDELNVMAVSPPRGLAGHRRAHTRRTKLAAPSKRRELCAPRPRADRASPACHKAVATTKRTELPWRISAATTRPESRAEPEDVARTLPTEVGKEPMREAPPHARSCRWGVQPAFKTGRRFKTGNDRATGGRGQQQSIARPRHTKNRGQRNRRAVSLQGLCL